MANYELCMRTNYFKVNDTDAFKKIATDLNLNYWEDKDKGFAFGTEEDYDLEVDSEGNECDTVKKLQDLLAEGEIIIITEIGHEKLRFLSGYSTIISKTEVVCVNLYHETVLKACTLSSKSPEEISEGMYY